MSISVDFNSEASCRKAYINYYCHNNSYGLSASDIGRIIGKYDESTLQSWTSSTSNDQTNYEISDSEETSAYKNGKNSAQSTTGYSGNNGSDIAIGVTDATLSVGSATMQLAGSAIIGTKGMSSVAKTMTTKGVEKTSNTLGKVFGKGGSKAAEVTAEDASAYISSYVAIALSLIEVGIYYGTKPNKEAVGACETLQSTMASSQQELNEDQQLIGSISEDLMGLSDEAYTMNEAANETIEEKKTEYDIYQTSFGYLMDKKASGSALTADEKELMQELQKQLSTTGKDINTIFDDTSSDVNDIYDDMGTYQSGYDEVASSMANILGVTDYAAGFDTSTKTMCYVEGASQTLNAGSAGLATARLLSSGIWWNYIIALAGAGAAVASGFAASEQFKYASKVDEEITLRQGTESLNLATADVYGSGLDEYAGYMEGIEDLEIEMPDEVDDPTEDFSGTTNGSTNSFGTSNTSNTGSTNNKNNKKNNTTA